MKKRSYKEQFDIARKVLISLGIIMVGVGAGIYAYFIDPLLEGPYKGLGILIILLGIYTIFGTCNWKFKDSLWGKREAKSIKRTRR